MDDSHKLCSIGEEPVWLVNLLNFVTVVVSRKMCVVRLQPDITGPIAEEAVPVSGVLPT